MTGVPKVILRLQSYKPALRTVKQKGREKAWANTHRHTHEHQLILKNPNVFPTLKSEKVK